MSNLNIKPEKKVVKKIYKKNIILIKKLYNKINKFIFSLSKEDIELLINDKASLELKKVKNKKNIGNKDKSNPEIDEICNILKTFLNEKDCLDYINNKNLKLSDLKLIAKNLNIRLSGKQTKETIIKQIIYNTIGLKNKLNSLLEIELK